MGSEQWAAELAQVQRELDELVDRRLSVAFTATEQQRYDELLVREKQLLAESRAEDSPDQRSRIWAAESDQPPGHNPA